MVITPTIEIPEEKTAAVIRFQAMSNDNWQALEGMTLEELDGFEREAIAARIIGIDAFSYHAQVINKTLDAIKRERSRRVLIDMR